MNALKSPANPTPVRSLVVRFLYAFYDSEFQSAKKTQESKTELQVGAEHRARHNAAWIGPVNPAKVQNRVVFFRDRSHEDTLVGWQ
jgi:hypothetical protein